MSVYVDIEKRLGDFHLNVNFSAGDEVLALLGASGCGKSMTLRCIAGIERPDRGQIIVDDITLFDSEKRINLSPQQRRTGLLFQNYALFPNMTVLQNVKAGAKREKSAALREKNVAQIMDSFGLSELAKHYPSQLSGGQQQRTALARILVSSPRILLLDEPFSALDNHLRFRLEREVRQVIHKFGKSVVLVSHNRDEVFHLADKLAVMHDGNVEISGDKDEVFLNPQTLNTALLTGCNNISRFTSLADGRVRALDWGIDLAVAQPAENETHVGIRMRDIRLGDGPNAFACKVVEELENPFSFTVMLSPESAEDVTPIGCEIDKTTWIRLRSARITANLPPDAIVLLRG